MAVSAAERVPAERTRHPSVVRRVWEPALAEWEEFGVHSRFDLAPGERVVGPALVVEKETTVVVPAGWTARVDSHAHLTLEAAK